MWVWNSCSLFTVPRSTPCARPLGRAPFCEKGGFCKIALIGWSPNPDRPSHRVAAYLVSKGYRVIPVNPGQAGKVELGEVVRASLSDIPDAIDMVDIFRRSEEVGAVVDEALRVLPGLTAIWMQLGVEDAIAAAKARAAGIDVVMNRCPAIEISRFGLR